MSHLSWEKKWFVKNITFFIYHLFFEISNLNIYAPGMEFDLSYIWHILV